MKKSSIFILVFMLGFLSLPVSGESFTYHQGFLHGKEEATNETGFRWSWAVGGFVGGSLLNIIGGGGTILAARLTKPPLKAETLRNLERRPTSYSLGYHDGYYQTMRKKNMQHTAIGAATGILVNLAILFTISIVIN